MIDTRIQAQIFCEIAMSIGNSLDLRAMLEESISSYLTNLNCSAGIVVEMKEETEGKFRFSPVFSLPANAVLIATCRSGLDCVPEVATEPELAALQSRLPISGRDEEGVFHIMELPGFGLLLLAKPGNPLSRAVMEDIGRLNSKLARACAACLQNDGMARINRKLADRIQDHVRIETELKEVLGEMELRVITERKNADEAIIRAEAKYGSIFENAVMGIFQITPRGELIGANNAFACILGYESAEELPRSKSELNKLIRAEADRCSELIRTIERDGVIHGFECRFLRPDGTPAWISINAGAVRDEEGRIDYLEGTALDITGRKMLETRLIQAQKMEAIGTLAGGIAHDFNNILAAIVGFAEMTKMALRDERLGGYMEQILQACNRAKNLVGQILAFSRAEMQEKKPLDIGEIIDEARRLLRATLPSTVEIRASKAPGVHPVLANRTQIHQVIINLCTNSTHAMREKGGLIEIDLDNFEIRPSMKDPHVDLDPGSYVKISVSDTGTGIDPTVMSRIFDPFFTTKKPGEGTGLGLSVVYGIVRESGGTITAHSEPGWGSVFTVYLPAVTAHIESAPELIGALPHGIERVLFIDDEELLVEMGKGMLENLGYKVTATTSSATALRFFSENPARFDLVITDTTMPDMNGVDLSREILKIRPDVPIILCTGFSELIDEENAAALGVKKFIMKPFSLKSIAEVIRGVLDG